MACYLCAICDNLTDGDYNPPETWNGQLVCQYCYTEFVDQEEE